MICGETCYSVFAGFCSKIKEPSRNLEQSHFIVHIMLILAPCLSSQKILKRTYQPSSKKSTSSYLLALGLIERVFTPLLITLFSYRRITPAKNQYNLHSPFSHYSKENKAATTSRSPYLIDSQVDAAKREALYTQTSRYFPLPFAISYIINFDPVTCLPTLISTSLSTSPCLLFPKRRTFHILPAKRNKSFYIIINSQLLSMLSLHPIALPSSVPQMSGLMHTDKICLFFEGKSYPQANARLFSDRIDIELTCNHQTQYFSMNFDFDLSFELLCLLPSSLKQNTSLWDSIKFERQSHTLEFRNIPNLLFWQKHLSLRLNQRGFHELFHSIRKIGEGNFAEVYYAVQKEGGQPCAVKAFSKQGTYKEAGGKEALMNEIAVMRKVKHRNLMQVYGVYESKNSIYVCVQLLAGGSLHSKLRTHNFSSLQIRTLMRSLLSGLQQLHSHNFMHRDLKPQNILFRTPNLECVIADFGLAEDVNSNPLIFPRCGTPGYIAPQIANLTGQQRYGTVCDMFSIGVIFHELIMGKFPFSAKDYQGVLQLNKLCKINFESFEYQQLPASWLSLLKGLMQKDPSKRLTAQAALEHQFFRKEPLIGRGSDRLKEQRKVCEKDKKEEKKLEEPIDSPLKSGKAGKRQAMLKNDSYLKLKSIEKTVSRDKKENRLHSPLLNKSNSKIAQSRFKPLVDHNS